MRPICLFPFVLCGCLYDQPQTIPDDSPQAPTRVDGYDLGSLSMTSSGLDLSCPEPSTDAPAASLPAPDVVPTDETNA